LIEEEEEEEEEFLTPHAVRCEVIAFLLARYGPATAREISRLLGCDEKWVKHALYELRRQGRARPERLGKQHVWNFIDINKKNIMFG